MNVKNWIALNVSKYADAFNLTDSENLGAGMLASGEGRHARVAVTGSSPVCNHPTPTWWSFYPGFLLLGKGLDANKLLNA